MHHHPVVRTLGLASFWLFTGCAEPEYPPVLNSVSVTCASPSVSAGETVQCTASALDQDGQPMPTAPRYAWTVMSESGVDLAMVDQEGKVTGLNPGLVRVNVLSVESGFALFDASVQLTILDNPKPRLSAVQVTCERVPRAVGRSMRCAASAKDQYEQPFLLTRSTWTTHHETVAKVDADGKVSIVGLGNTALIVAATGGNITREGVYPLQIKAPTEHRGPITASETWRQEDNPHLVTTTLVVGGPRDPILNVEAGVDVLFAPGAALMIGSDEQNPGTLRVNGFADRPVLFTAQSATPQPGDWAGMYFLRTSPAKGSRLNHATLEYAGGALEAMPSTPGVQQLRGALNVLAHPEATEPGTRVTLGNVEVRASQEHGFVLGAKLDSISESLKAHDNGKAGLVVAANAVGSIPRDSQLTGNGIGEILVWAGTVTESQWWPRLEVPYRIISLVDSLPAYVSVGSTANPSLTLEAGTRLLMPAGSAFLVGLSGLGELSASGGEEPIQFMADTASPTPGHWSGLHFMEDGRGRLSHVQVSHAGARLQGSLGGGAVNVYKEGVFSMTRSTLRASSGCGVSVAPGVTTDFSAPESGNLFVDLAGANQCTQP